MEDIEKRILRMNNLINKETEISIVKAAKTGDEKSFEQLYTLYYKKVFALAKTTLKNDADAEDVLQQTFISAWNNLKNLQDEGSFNAWIQRIAINKCYSILRKKHPDISMDDDEVNLQGVIDLQSDLMLPEVYSQREDLKIRLAKIIDALSNVQRQTIQLYYYDQMSIEEIARAMDCSVNTVKSRLFLARNAIKVEIEETEKKTGEKFFTLLLTGAPAVALSILFTKKVEAAQIVEAKATGIYCSIMNTVTGAAITGIGAETAGKTTAEKAAASKVAGSKAASAGAKTGSALATKIIAGVVSVALIVAGTGGAIAQTKAPAYSTEPDTVLVDPSKDGDELVSEITEHYDTEILDKINGISFFYGSGVGGWGDSATISAGGAFVGEYSENHNGDTSVGAGYMGSRWECNYSGKFVHPKKIDDYKYTVEIEGLSYEKPEGTVYDKEISGAKFKTTITSPCVLYGKSIDIYLPGTPTSMLPENAKKFFTANNAEENGRIVNYVLVNPSSGYAMITSNEATKYVYKSGSPYQLYLDTLKEKETTIKDTGAGNLKNVYFANIYGDEMPEMIVRYTSEYQGKLSHSRNHAIYTVESGELKKLDDRYADTSAGSGSPTMYLFTKDGKMIIYSMWGEEFAWTQYFTEANFSSSGQISEKLIMGYEGKYESLDPAKTKRVVTYYEGGDFTSDKYGMATFSGGKEISESEYEAKKSQILSNLDGFIGDSYRIVDRPSNAMTYGEAVAFLDEKIADYEAKEAEKAASIKAEEASKKAEEESIAAESIKAEKEAREKEFSDKTKDYYVTKLPLASCVKVFNDSDDVIGSAVDGEIKTDPAASIEIKEIDEELCVRAPEGNKYSIALVGVADAEITISKHIVSATTGEEREGTEFSNVCLAPEKEIYIPEYGANDKLFVTDNGKIISAIDTNGDETSATFKNPVLAGLFIVMAVLGAVLLGLSIFLIIKLKKQPQKPKNK